MYKKIITLFLSVILLISAFSYLSPSIIHAEDTSEENNDSTNENEELKIACEAAIVMDADTGQVIYEKNSHKRLYPASITKIMTALVALENTDFNSTVTMTEDAIWGIDRDSTHIALDVDEQISFKDAFYAMLIVSANEVSWGIADHVSGSLDAFCKLMNDKAKELGCEDTNFVNANGLHDDNHYTTAYDMALITREALNHPEFVEATSTTYYVIPPTNKNSDERILWQDNKLIMEDSEYYYSACKGGKTGFTDQAGGTLVAWATKDDMNLICVTLNGIPSYENYNDTINLFDYVFSHYSKTNPLETYEFEAEELTRAQNFLNNHYNCENLGTVRLHVKCDNDLILPWDYDFQKAKIDISYNSDNLDQGIIGTFSLTYEGVKYITLPIEYSGYINSKDEAAIQKAIDEGILPKPKSKLLIALKKLFIFLIIIAILVFIYKRYDTINKKRAEASKYGNTHPILDKEKIIKKLLEALVYIKNLFLLLIGKLIEYIKSFITFIVSFIKSKMK